MVKTVSIDYYLKIEDIPQPEQDDSQRSPYDIETVKGLIEYLPEIDQAIIQLYFFNGLPDQTIARVLKINYDTLYSRRISACKRIKLLWEIYTNLPPDKIYQKEFSPVENRMLSALYWERKKTYFNKLKLVISKIKELETRKYFNLLYNFSFFFRNSKYQKTKLPKEFSNE